MNLSFNFKRQLEKAKKKTIIVEGKKDKTALENLGFAYVFKIEETGKSLYKKIEEIEEKIKEKNTPNKICILTDFDKQGKKLYSLLKKEFNKKGIKMDNSFRDKLLKLNISHIEGLPKFLSVKQNGKYKKNRKSNEKS